MNKIGIIGAGLIGSSWSAIFASKGYEVFVYDKNQEAFDDFNQRVELFLKELKYIGPLWIEFLLLFKKTTYSFIPPE